VPHGPLICHKTIRSVLKCFLNGVLFSVIDIYASNRRRLVKCTSCFNIHFICCGQLDLFRSETAKHIKLTEFYKANALLCRTMFAFANIIQLGCEINEEEYESEVFDKT
jgi:hypothetical protein